MTFHSNLGSRLSDVLKAKQISKKQFAEMMNVSPTQVTRWVQAHSFQWHQINAFTKALGISPMEFLLLEENAHENP